MTLRSDSKKARLVLYEKFSKSYKNDGLSPGELFPADSLLAQFCPYLPPPPTSFILGGALKQVICLPRVGFMSFMQIVKNSTTVGRRMTTGSDSLPLVSFSDTYQSPRNRNNTTSTDESQQVIARLDLLHQVG